MNTPHDQDFEALLKEYEAEFDRYRQLPEAGPSRELDIAIMAKAREAVAKPKPHRARWLVPLASVASLALAAGIGWRTFQADRVEQAATVERAAASADEQIVEFEWIDLPNRDAERKEMANSPPLPAPAAGAPVVAAAPPPPAPPPPAESMPEELAKQAPIVASEAVAPAASVPTADPFPASPAKSAEREFTEPHVAADHAVMAEPPETTNRVAQFKPGAPTDALRAENDADGSAATGALAKSDEKAKKVFEPEEWIARIRELRSGRRFHEVKKELAEFKKTYPNYPLPSDLEKLGR